MFTLNNPEGLIYEDEWKALEKVTYVVYQEEMGDKGTHHLQGYIELNSPQRYCLHNTPPF